MIVSGIVTEVEEELSIPCRKFCIRLKTFLFLLLEMRSCVHVQGLDLSAQ